eukprot:CAMPEP_0117515314 /NCGR_PEP_ID=MMETSP0784-20121206/30517_1 /TAXON_ID=39447 /ORGANISM="" /LENGTH=33 /DNA_ID= /DNA_START= /DNA_END= /DNA_ORIENTATION=
MPPIQPMPPQAPAMPVPMPPVMAASGLGLPQRR